MSRVSAYHLGREVFTTNQPVPGKGRTVVRHTGEFTEPLTFDVSSTVSFYRFIQLAPFSGSRATVTLNPGPSQEVLHVDEHTPLHIYLDSAIESVSVEAFPVSGDATPSIDLVIFVSDKSTEPAPPVVYTGPWLVLDASTGVSRNIDGSVISWIDTRQERSLDKQWNPVEDVTEDGLFFNESDADFGGAPSFTFPPYRSSFNNRARFVYSEAIGDMTGDKSPQFMRGDQDFTVLAVAWTRESNLNVGTRIFAASDNIADDPPVAGSDPANRVFSYENDRFGASTVTPPEWSEWTQDSSVISRQANENKAAYFIYSYEAATRTLRIYTQGEWKEPIVYSGAQNAVDFTDVPVVGGGALDKVNHVTVYKRLLSDEEILFWQSENAPKVDDFNNWKRDTMTGAGSYFVPAFMDAYDIVGTESTVAADSRTDSGKISGPPFINVDTQLAGWRAEDTDDGWRTSLGTTLYVPTLVASQQDQVEGDYHQLICFKFYGQSIWNANGTPSSGGGNQIGCVWGRDGHYVNSTPELNFVLNRVPQGGSSYQTWRFTAESSGYLSATPPSAPAYVAGTDGLVSVGDVIACSYRVNNSSEQAKLVVKNLNAGWTATYYADITNSGASGPLEDDVVIGGWDRANGVNKANTFGCDLTLHEVTVRNDNLTDSQVDEWFSYVQKRWT